VKDGLRTVGQVAVMNVLGVVALAALLIFLDYTEGGQWVRAALNALFGGTTNDPEVTP
jgi:hypothetical protein